MKRIEDERIRFYLKHRQQIEEWVRVGEELPGFVREFYASLRIPEIACETGIKIEYENWGIRLRRPKWPKPVAIELGWVNNISWRDNAQEVWCGISLGEKSLYYDWLSRQVIKGYDRSSTRWGYPAYKGIGPPSGNSWEGDNLEKYGNSVIEALLQAWSNLAPLVDEAVLHQHNQP